MVDFAQAARAALWPAMTTLPFSLDNSSMNTI